MDERFLLVELQRRLDLQARVWSLFQHLDFVDPQPAQEMAETLAVALNRPINGDLRSLLRESLEAHGIIAVKHSSSTFFRAADWRQRFRQRCDQRRLDSMDPIDRRIRELTAAKRQQARET